MVLPPQNTRYCDFFAILSLFIGRVFQNLRGSRHFIHSSVSAHDKAIGSCHRIRYELVVIRVTLLPNKRILPLTRCLLMGDPNIVSYIDGKYYDYRCLMIFFKTFFLSKRFLLLGDFRHSKLFMYGQICLYDKRNYGFFSCRRRCSQRC